MLALEQYDTVRFRGEDHQVQAIAGSKVILRSLVSGKTLETTVSELLASIRVGGDGPTFAAERILDTLSDEDAKVTRFWYGHVTEIITGRNPNLPDSASPKPDYASDKSLGQRIQAKCIELSRDGIEVSQITMRRKVQALKHYGITGLIDSRKRRTSSETGRVPEEIITVVEELISSETLSSTRGKSYMVEVIAHEVALRGIIAPLPSRATLYRLLGQLGDKRHTFGSAMTRRTTANSKPVGHRPRLARFPGETVEIDSTPLDVMIILPDGEIARAELTAVIDVATRSLCSWVIKQRGTKAVDAVDLLARAMTPLPLLPGADERMALARSILADTIFLADGDPAVDIAAKPVIKPLSITVDHGKVFISDTFLRACSRLNIQVVKASPYTPTDKPHIERSFATINSLFTQCLPGYVGKNPALKGKDPTTEALLTLDQVRSLFEYWVITVYQNRPHDGLRLPLMPKKRLSPNQMYATLSEVFPQAAVAFTKDDYVGLLPVRYRTIKRDGVTNDGLRYDSPALHPYREMHSGNKLQKDKWEIRYDPYDLTSIWIRVPDKESFIEVKWVYAEYLATGFSIELLQAAKAMLTHREPTQSDILAVIKQLQNPNQCAEDSKTTTRRSTSRQGARHESRTSIEPAVRTSPEDSVASPPQKASDDEDEQTDDIESVEPYPMVGDQHSWW
ncbi:Mu transposase C-terminal domain-containing protein [Ferrimicrobium acidiphilum]|uniref:Mu transposase C-terminal domain-containing protein n=2 Tax=Ferrimicrobium acidiphilum TaxID=121039 RepID=A0ABV3Y4G9_9ACTN